MSNQSQVTHQKHDAPVCLWARIDRNKIISLEKIGNNNGTAQGARKKNAFLAGHSAQALIPPPPSWLAEQGKSCNFFFPYKHKNVF